MCVSPTHYINLLLLQPGCQILEPSVVISQKVCMSLHDNHFLIKPPLQHYILYMSSLVVCHTFIAFMPLYGITIPCKGTRSDLSNRLPERVVSFFLVTAEVFFLSQPPSPLCPPKVLTYSHLLKRMSGRRCSLRQGPCK